MTDSIPDVIDPATDNSPDEIPVDDKEYRRWRAAQLAKPLPGLEQNGPMNIGDFDWKSALQDLASIPGAFAGEAAARVPQLGGNLAQMAWENAPVYTPLGGLREAVQGYRRERDQVVPGQLRPSDATMGADTGPVVTGEHAAGAIRSLEPTPSSNPVAQMGSRIAGGVGRGVTDIAAIGGGAAVGIPPEVSMGLIQAADEAAQQGPSAVPGGLLGGGLMGGVFRGMGEQGGMAKNAAVGGAMTALQGGSPEQIAESAATFALAPKVMGALGGRGEARPDPLVESAKSDAALADSMGNKELASAISKQGDEIAKAVEPKAPEAKAVPEVIPPEPTEALPTGKPTFLEDFGFHPDEISKMTPEELRAARTAATKEVMSAVEEGRPINVDTARAQIPQEIINTQKMYAAQDTRARRVTDVPAEIPAETTTPVDDAIARMKQGAGDVVPSEIPGTPQSVNDMNAADADRMAVLGHPEVRNILREQGKDPDAMIAEVQAKMNARNGPIPDGFIQDTQQAPVAEKTQVQPAGTPANQEAGFDVDSETASYGIPSSGRPGIEEVSPQTGTNAVSTRMFVARGADGKVTRGTLRLTLEPRGPRQGQPFII